jgi:hypothetical protein
MMAPVLDPGSYLAVRVAVAEMFTVAALGKLRAPARFAETLREYRLLPGWAVLPTSRALPVMEILVAAGLAIPLGKPWPALGAAGLLLLFAAAMAANLARGRGTIDCGCAMGAGRVHRLRWAFVARNLAAASLLALPATGRAGPGDAILGVLGGVAVFIVLQAANTLWSLPAPAVSARAS